MYIHHITFYIFTMKQTTTKASKITFSWTLDQEVWISLDNSWQYNNQSITTVSRDAFGRLGCPLVASRVTAFQKGSVPRCNTLIAFKQPWQLENKTPGSCYEWLSGIFQLVYNIWEITNLSHDHGVAIFHNYFLFTKCRQRLNRPTVRYFVIITNTQPQLVPN